MAILKDAVVAIADGKLTSGASLSFDTTEKMIPFQPAYKVPVISMGRFNYFSAHFGQPWHLMYSGTYALCSEIINLFRKRISSFYLERDYGLGGAPALSHSFDKSSKHDDDYNFSSDELIGFHRSTILGEFKTCLQEKADEWLRNGKDLDCGFILFGRSDKCDDDQDKTYVAFKVVAERDPSFASTARIRVDTVPYLTPVAIGDPAAATEIVTDNDLGKAIIDSVPKPASPTDQWYHFDASATTGVAARLVGIVRSLSIASVGGQLIVGSAQAGGDLRLQTIPSPT